MASPLVSLGTLFKHLPYHQGFCLLTTGNARSVASPLVSVGTLFNHPPSHLGFYSLTTGNALSSVCRASLSSSDCSLDAPNFSSLDSCQQIRIRQYVSSLLEWNQKMNLTAVKEENEVMDRHVNDSLAIIEPIRNSYLSHCGSSVEKLRVIDVGSGAGLPGLVLAIACPGWKLTLLESMNKRCAFLEHVVGLIGLQNVQIVRDRAENLGHHLDFREGFDIAVARAVAEMRILSEYCLPLVRVGGLFVAAKGHDPQEEVMKAERAIHLTGGSLLRTCTVESHSKSGQRTAIICRKDRPTPRKYPRASGIPSKLPL